MHSKVQVTKRNKKWCSGDTILISNKSPGNLNSLRSWLFLIQLFVQKQFRFLYKVLCA